MKELEESIEKTLETSDLSNINIDLAELTLDAILEDGIAKDLPIVGSIVGISKFGIKVKEQIFLKKVLKFLTKLNKTTPEERSEFINRIEQTEKYNKKVGLAIILILDKLEDLEKPEIIGKLLTANIKEEIDYETFLRISYMVQKVFLPDLKFLQDIKDGKEVYYHKQDELYLSGLMITEDTGGARFDGRNIYKISPYGEILLNIIKS
ncbi:hypothetical protein [Maribacter sp. 2304DJ31-5]|uniref:hypothetical protein n=1 Tax=Maribacter sp. 2304DJ31-5 TaxID=3386273 RepID=UPI0039BD7BEF